MASTDPQNAPRTRRRGADRKREILAAACEVFSTNGYEKTSVAEIAARVGIVEGAVYKHFATKRELLFEAARAFYRPVIEQTREQLEVVVGPRNRLRFLVWCQLRAFAEQPGFCRLIIQDVRPHRDYQSSVVYELNREITSLALDILEEGVAAGEFRSDLPADMIRDVIFGGIEHVMWKALAGHGAPDIDRLADRLTELMIGGIAARTKRVEARIDRLERKLDALGLEPETRERKETNG